MEAFKSVDEKNLKKVFRSDGQGDWHRWKTGDAKTAEGISKSSHYKRARHAPSFPKIGTNSAPDDKTNFEVGEHDEVLIPQNIAKKKFHHWREAMAHGEAEKIQNAPKKKPTPAKADGAQEEKTSLPAGWHEMVEPDTDKKYYFHDATGETRSSPPPVADNNGRKAFISAGKFDGKREGYYFGSGQSGIGYYLDIKLAQPEEIDPMIGTTMQPLEKKEVVPIVTMSSKKIAKRRAEYGASLMEVIARSISEHAKKHPALHPKGATPPVVVKQVKPSKKGVAPPRPPPIEWQTLRK